MPSEFERMLYPRVSDIYAPYSGGAYAYLSTEMLAKAAERGDKVEEYCIGLLKNEFLPQLDDECSLFVKAFEDWANDHILECLVSKTRLYDDERRFSGEFDLLVTLKESKKPALIDLKCTAAVHKFWPIQLSAYHHLCRLNGYDVDEAFNLQLQRTSRLKGDERIVKVSAKKREHGEITPYFTLFQSALDLYNFFLREDK